MMRMPLKFKWGKKSGRYDLSQDIYVLTVYVGDVALAQCTLTSESTPLHVMEYLRQKIDLNQIELFGLRYQMRCNDPDKRIWRWVEMNRPLKKQLEKLACKPRQVNLAILFHTPNAFALHDHMSRSIYFVLLKLEVISGQLIMDMDKYITLAAHSLQVKYSDYDPLVHTLDFLRSLPLLPSHLYRNPQFVEDILLRILSVYESLSGVQPMVAALMYIANALQCEGYGEEYFQGKDDESVELQFGYTPDGISIKKSHSKVQKYRWDELKEITTNKRNVVVKCKDGSGFFVVVDDAEMARYICMVFHWQWHYGTKDAPAHKAIPHNLNHMQGGMKLFGAHPPPLRLSSNAESQSTRTTNSIDLGPCSSSTTCSNGYLGSSMIINALNFHSTMQTSLHSLNNVNVKLTTPSISTHSIPNHSVLSAMKVSPRPYGLNGVKNGVSVASPKSTTPDAAAVQNLDNEKMKLVEREILKQLLIEQGNIAKTIGSSPEIHMIGTNNNCRTANSHLLKRIHAHIPRAYLSVAAYDTEKNQHAVSTPDLSLKWTSTPELHNRISQNARTSSMETRDVPLSAATTTDSEASSSSANSQGSSHHRFKKFDHHPATSAIHHYTFSQGQVISSTLQRSPGQTIMYPIPPVHLTGINVSDHMNFGPPKLNGHLTPPILNNKSNPAQKFSRKDHLLRLEENPELERRPIMGHHHHPEQDRQMAGSSSASSSSTSPMSIYSGLPGRPFETDSSEMRDIDLKSSKHVLLNGVILSNHSELVNENWKRLESNDEALSHLTQKFSNPEAIEREFQTIPTKRMSAGTSTSQYPENQTKNRSRYILPYEDTRVMLHPHDKNPHGYINASNVQLPIADKLFKYIITQSPLSHTIEDFWQMIWESNARVIVMLSNKHEEKNKLDDLPTYWPTPKKSKINLRNFNIKLQNCSSTRFLTTSVMHIKQVSGGEKRSIYHLHFSDFSTDSIAVPSREDAFLGFIDAVNSVRRHVENERIHDSANELAVNGKEKTKSRSRSIGRTSLYDVTNRIRSQSVENGGWRRKLTFSINGQSSNLSCNSEFSTSISNGQHFYRDLNADYFPTIVHCLDGTSESGVYVLVEVLIHCFENNIDVDTPKVLRTLRQQRMHLIRSLHQYRFVYSVLINYLQKSRLI